MASFDGAFESLVQGVTEQVPTSRLPGQVTEQVNMVSDLITGVRRRVGTKLRAILKSEGATNSFKAWQTDVGGVRAECYLNVNTGELIMLEEGNLNEMVRFQSDYLRALNVRSIRHAGVGDSLFIGNTERIPKEVLGDDKLPFRSVGFYSVVGSTLRQKFEVTVTDGDNTYTGTYTTPDGTDPTHSQFVGTPFIAERLMASLRGETWVFPRRGKLTQPPTTYKPNGTNLHNVGGGIYFRFRKSGASIVTTSPTQSSGYRYVRSDMPGGYLRLSHRSYQYSGSTLTDTTITVVKVAPNTTYSLKFMMHATIGGGTVSFTTPDGELPEHSKYLTPQGIIDELYKAMDTGMDTVIPPVVWEDNPQAPAPDPVIHRDPSNRFAEFFQGTVTGNDGIIKGLTDKPLNITQGLGKVYLETSGNGILKTVGELPNSLPEDADGAVMAVGGTGSTLTYFRYNSSNVRWEETSLPGSPIGIENMPVEIYWDGDSWVLNDEPFEGRLSGDSETNPNPEFIDWGITGISSYQGRLVVLSGSWVYLSASNAPRLFYRSTVEELLDSDTIGIGSSSTSSASFEYGEVFNKDLLLFSPEHQALIPGLSQALTPKTAHILITSTYTSDMTCPPITTGSSVMYPMPRSSKYYGMMEMIPSSYTESMYMSSDASEHIPNYMKGRCRFAVASSVGSMVIMGSTEDLKTLYIHEYMWSGEEKVLKSWHKWTFKTDIAHAFFSGELVNLVTVDPKQGSIVVTNLDPKAVYADISTSETYFLDFYTKLKVQELPDSTKYCDIPEDYYNLIKNNNLEGELRVAYSGGSLNTSAIGFDLEGRRIILNRSTTAKEIVIGVPYESKLVPSPPVFRDFMERPILFNRVQMMKMYALTDRTGIFEVTVLDKPRGEDLAYNVNPIKWLSKDLNLGRLPVGGQEGSVIPVRVDATTGRIEFTSNGLDEMNIINIEYTCKAGKMRQRR